MSDLSHRIEDAARIAHDLRATLEQQARAERDHRLALLGLGTGVASFLLLGVAIAFGGW